MVVNAVLRRRVLRFGVSFGHGIREKNGHGKTAGCEKNGTETSRCQSCNKEAGTEKSRGQSCNKESGT